MSSNLAAAEVCEATGCLPVTLRSWRNRNGLFPHHKGGGGWTRYDLADALGVRLVVLLTARGFAAQEACEVVNEMRGILEKAVAGFAPWVGVGRSIVTDRYEFHVLDSAGTVLDHLGWFLDDVVVVVNLNAITLKLVDTIRMMQEDGK